MAFADNATFLCPLSKVKDVYLKFADLLKEAGMELNVGDSRLLIPALQYNLSPASLPGGILHSHASFVNALSENQCLPVVTEGERILCAPFGSVAFMNAFFAGLVQKIDLDLELLAQLPDLHVRAKLLVYCVKKLLDYFLGTIDLEVTLPYAQIIDEHIESAVRLLLGWENLSAEEF